MYGENIAFMKHAGLIYWDDFLIFIKKCLDWIRQCFELKRRIFYQLNKYIMDQEYKSDSVSNQTVFWLKRKFEVYLNSNRIHSNLKNHIKFTNLKTYYVFPLFSLVHKDKIKPSPIWKFSKNRPLSARPYPSPSLIFFYSLIIP